VKQRRQPQDHVARPNLHPGPEDFGVERDIAMQNLRALGCASKLANLVE